MSADATDRDALAVVICTHRRPDALGRLLDRLVECADDAASVAVVGVVVVDDDPDASARATAESRAGAFELGLDYRVTGSGNISVARNTTLEAGAAMAPWVACTDDDCIPAVDWLSQLVAVRRRTGADAVCGACDELAPPGAPAWLVDEPFLDELTTGVDGERTVEGHVKNLLLSTEFVARHGVSYDERLGRAGGEDAKFLHDLDRAGIDRRFASHAIVREELTAARATLRYQLRRRFWFGNTESVTSIENGRASRVRMFVSGARQCLRAVLGPFTRLARGGSPWWRFAASELLRGIGRMLGAVGIVIDHR